MTILTKEKLWLRLQQANLVEGEMPETTTIDSPWYIRVMLGIAGWMGALFFLGFFGTAFVDLFRDEEALVAVGLMCCSVAYGIFKFTRAYDFGIQFGLAISLCGQAMVIWGIHGFTDGETIFYFSIFIFELLLTLFLSNFLHRILTSWAAMVALFLALNHLGFYGFGSGIAAIGFAWIWINEFQWTKYEKLWHPVGYGLALSLLLANAYLIWGHHLSLPMRENAANWFYQAVPWISASMIGGIFLLLVVRILMRENIVFSSRTGIIALLGSVLATGLALPMVGVASGLLILVVGFDGKNRVLIGMGILALLVFLSNYYYTLQTTLLVKSMILIGFGLLLLMARFIMERRLPGDAAANREGH